MGRHSTPGWAAALLCGASALAGCDGHGGGQMTTNGVLTVDVRPTTMPPAGLTISGGRVHIEGLTVLGDVAPTGRSMVSEFSLDLASTGASFSLSELPQGVYSRVHLNVESVGVTGSWRGMPLQFAYETEPSIGVDLRADGVEIAPGHDGELAVGVDAGAWFAGNVLDGATPDGNGALVVDPSHNPVVAATVASRVGASFSLSDSTATR